MKRKGFCHSSSCFSHFKHFHMICPLTIHVKIVIYIHITENRRIVVALLFQIRGLPRKWKISCLDLAKQPSREPYSACMHKLFHRITQSVVRYHYMRGCICLSCLSSRPISHPSNCSGLIL